jgi:hypothetical protein
MSFITATPFPEGNRIAKVRKGTELIAEFS